MPEDRLLSDRPKPYEVERDRLGVYYSGPLEVGECIEVVPASWDGLMMILDRRYPADVFTGASGDPGPRIVALTREVGRLRAALIPFAFIGREFMEPLGLAEEYDHARELLGLNAAEETR